MFWLAVVMLPSACESPPAQDDTTTGVTSTDASSSDTSTSTGTDTDTDTDTDDTDTVTTEGPKLDTDASIPCDPFAQDCPGGEKCVPYSSGGVELDAHKCVPILGDGAPGESCVSDGIVEGTDDCGADSYCFYAAADMNGARVGTCTGFCQGPADMPSCPVGSSCPLFGNGTLGLCLDTCDPLAQDCTDGGCYWYGNEFVCVPSSQNLAEGEPCGEFVDCAPGLICLEAGVLLDCNAAACCASFCALDDVAACPQPGLECVAYFEQGLAPIGLENLGVCTVPGA